MPRYKINFKNIEWTSPIAGMRVKSFFENEKQIRLVEYSKEMKPHWCEKGHYGLIPEGKMEIEFAGRKEVYSEGNGIFIPGGPENKHKGIPLTDVAKVMFVEDVKLI